MRNNYSRITLRLSDSSLSGLLWDFSTEEIQFTMPYFTILATVFAVGIIFSYDYKIQILIHVSEFSIYVVVHVVGNKFKKCHVYGMLILFAIRMIVICTSQYFRNESTDKDPDSVLRASYDVMV